MTDQDPQLPAEPASNADLRRLAEQARDFNQAGPTAIWFRESDDELAGLEPIDAAYIAAANPQAILALLDRLIAAENEQEHMTEVATFHFTRQEAAERRVAALEEGLQALLAQWDAENLHGMAVAADKARALLDRPADPAAEPHPFSTGDLGNPTYEWCTCGQRRGALVHFPLAEQPAAEKGAT